MIAMTRRCTERGSKEDSLFEIELSTPAPAGQGGTGVGIIQTA